MKHAYKISCFLLERVLNIFSQSFTVMFTSEFRYSFSCHATMALRLSTYIFLLL